MSDVAFNSKLSGIDMIRQESRSMCKDKVWAPFLCVLALSSVLNKKIVVHYPEFGPIKFCNFFNQTILPRSFYDPTGSTFGVVKTNNFYNILFCRLTRGDSVF